MSRRGYDRRQQCAQQGCREISITHYDLQRDYKEALQREKRNDRPPWKCSRHAKPEEVLSIDNPCVMSVQTSEEKFSTIDPKRSIGVYWGHSGFIYGQGFKAWAGDFPAGTKLIVTAQIELPNGYEPPAPPPPPPPPTLMDRFGGVDLDKEQR